MVFIGLANGIRQAFSVNMRTWGVRQATDQERGIDREVVGGASRRIYYLSGSRVKWTHIDTGDTQEICELDLSGDVSLGGFSVNADETLLLAHRLEGAKECFTLPRSQWFTKIFEAHLPNALFTIDIVRGAVREFHRENNWLGHVQFSPRDPGRLMFCHEGPWGRLQRIWLIRVDGTDLRPIHERKVEGEIAGHELWDPSGGKVWFDLRAPGRPPALACADIETGEETVYELKPEQWSVHYNIDASGSRLCGDGDRGGPYIYLFVPEGDAMRAERLCCLPGHDYKLEPNVHFSPDGRYVVFGAGLDGGPSQAYCVEAGT
jgi:oligogalacturonide lyase